MTAAASSAPSGAMSIPGSHPHPSAAAGPSSSRPPLPSHGTAQQRRPHGHPRDRHALALESIRHFLKGRSSYDVLPVSFRLIVLDTQLVVGPALEVMWSAGVVSAPLWHSIPVSGGHAGEEGDTEGQAAPPQPRKPTQKPGFAGMLTVNDIIHLIQYYYHHSSYDTAKDEVETFRLEGLRDIEAKLAVPPPPLLSCHPLRPLLDACQLLMKTHARRLPLLDHDEQTGIETVVSVLTQYRVLKFIAMNVGVQDGVEG